MKREYFAYLVPSRKTPSACSASSFARASFTAREPSKMGGGAKPARSASGSSAPFTPVWTSPVDRRRGVYLRLVVTAGARAAIALVFLRLPEFLKDANRLRQVRLWKRPPL